MKVSFGQRLRQIRQASDISQEKLAALAGLDRTYVSKIERGERNVTLDVVEKLALALGVAPYSFFSGDK